MLQKTFQVILKKFPSEIMDECTLAVGIEKYNLETHGITQSSSELKQYSSFIGALIRYFPNLHEPFNCTFIQTHILDNFEKKDDNEIISLYVNETFLQYFNFTYNDICYFKPVKCYPLEKILFGAKSAESFFLFQDTKIFSNFVKQVNKETILCRQGDVPVISISNISHSNLPKLEDLVVLDCQPFNQGLLTLKSSIILADLSDASNRAVIKKNTEPNICDGAHLIDLINYTSSNFLGIRLHQPSITLPSAISILKITSSFQIQLIPKLNVDFCKEMQNLNEEIDPLNTVFISFNSQKIGNIRNGSWVKIEILKSSDDHSKVPKEFQNINAKLHIKRLAQICIFSNKNLLSKYFYSDDVAYISPLLWFNLNAHPSRLIQPEARLLIEPMEKGFSPSQADEAFACLIPSPHYDGKINCDALLKKYFNIPRYVCKGDIFSLNSKDQLDFHSRIQDEEVDKLKWPVIYFRISIVEGITSSFGHLLSTKYTRLYQSGTKQSYVPVTMETYYQLSSYHPIWNAISNGLYQYIEELQDLILPFLKLQGRSKISSNFLFTGPPCCGKTTVIKAVCRCLNLHLYQVNCHEFSGETSAAIETRLKNKMHKGSTYAPCVILLKNVHCIGREKEPLGEDSRVIHSLANLMKDVNSFGGEWPIIVIGTAVDQRNLSSNLVSVFLHSVHMAAPNEEERCLLIEDLLTACDVGSDVSVSYLAQRTAGFVLGDLSALINQGIKNAYSRMNKMVKEKKLSSENEEDIVLATVPVVQQDLLNALEKLQSEFADAIGAPKIPNVKFDDVGGLSVVKQEILDTIQLPLEHPEILSSGLRRSGVLLYGPPGSGKTMLAKAVATECSLNFLSVKGPELINMYVGQSEENVRAVFSQARSAVPCIIFFDELDSLAPNRGRSGDSGGVMDRVVSQLLAELDGLNKKSEVFVIGATNRPDLLDPALLRPGRFDRLLYVGIPEDNRSKHSILKALTRKFPLAADVDLFEIVRKCPPHLSGADFYSLCSNAVIQRVEKNVEMIENGDKNIKDVNCEVTTEDFMSALETLVPSVSPEQYQEYLNIKAKIEQE